MLSELRLLASTDFDSRVILSVVFTGDARLNDKLRRDTLLPFGSRIRVRLPMDYVGRDVLLACLEHLLNTSGNPRLMSKALKATLCDHAMGNYRALTTRPALIYHVKGELCH